MEANGIAAVERLGPLERIESESDRAPLPSRKSGESAEQGPDPNA